MIIKALACLLSALALSACAIPEPPPGGPEDKTPPSVEGTIPADGEAGVAPDQDITILFSESMSRSRLERSVQFYPPASLSGVKWKKDRVILKLEEPLHPDTTYVVELQPGFADAHNVRSEKGYRFAFATSAHIDSGVVSGHVLFRRKPTPKGVVRGFVLPKDSTFAPEATRPDRQVSTNVDGAYELDRLPTSGRGLVLWAFEDGNSNSAFDASSEFGAIYADTVVLGPSITRRDGIEISIVDPTEPAEVTGHIDNRTSFDSVLVAVTMHEIGDTVPPTHYFLADLAGDFTYDRVLKGAYIVYAFLDFHVDSLCGDFPCPDDTTRACPEPCVQYPDTVIVEPGQKIRLDDLTLENG